MTKQDENTQQLVGTDESAFALAPNKTKNNENKHHLRILQLERETVKFQTQPT